MKEAWEKIPMKSPNAQKSSIEHFLIQRVKEIEKKLLDTTESTELVKEFDRCASNDTE